MEFQSIDERNEQLWHQYLSLLEHRPNLTLVSFIRLSHIGKRGFEKWLYSRGYSVQEAKRRILQLKASSMPDESSVSGKSSFLPVVLNGKDSEASSSADMLAGISLTLPDGTVISIRRGSAEAVVSFLKLYSGEGASCSA